MEVGLTYMINTYGEVISSMRSGYRVMRYTMITYDQRTYCTECVVNCILTHNLYCQQDEMTEFIQTIFHFSTFFV